MRVLISGYVGKKITGIGRTLIETIKYLPLKSGDKLIIATNYDNLEIIDLESEHIQIIRLPISKKSTLLNIILNVFVFPILSITSKADVVYIPNFIPILLKFKPTIAVIHDLIEFNLTNKFSKLRTFYRKMIVPTLARRSNHIITVSNYSKKDIIHFFGVKDTKISVLYNSVFDVEEFENKPAKENNIKYLLYVGTIDYPGKGVHSLINGYEEFINKYNIDDLELRLIGMNGKDSDVIDSMIEKSKFKKKIERLGYINQKDLEEEYLNAFIFCFLSYYEGFGLPIIEAMRYEIPCIVSNRSCLPEIAGKAAMIVDPNNSVEIADSIYELYSSHDTRIEFKKLMKENLKRFSWEETSNKTYDILSHYSQK